MLTISFISQKGGAGKSTLAIHVAAEAASRGQRTLLVDLDPQGNASQWGDRRGDLPPDVSAENPVKLEVVLSTAEADGYDLVVVDTAPHADQTAIRAARASNLVMIPCRPTTFDLEAIATTLDICALAKANALVILNAAPIRSRVVGEAVVAIKGHNGVVGAVPIRQRVAYQHCMIDGRTAGEYEPGGAAADEISALYDDMLTHLHDGMSALHHVESSARRRISKMAV